MAPLEGVQGDRVQSSLLTLSTVPFYTKLKAQIHFQVTKDWEQNKLGGKRKEMTEKERDFAF